MFRLGADVAFTRQEIPALYKFSPEFLASNSADKLRYYVAMEGPFQTFMWAELGKVARFMVDVIMPFTPNLLFEPPVYSWNL